MGNGRGARRPQGPTPTGGILRASRLRGLTLRRCAPSIGQYRAYIGMAECTAAGWVCFSYVCSVCFIQVNRPGIAGPLTRRRSIAGRALYCAVNLRQSHPSCRKQSTSTVRQSSSSTPAQSCSGWLLVGPALFRLLKSLFSQSSSSTHSARFGKGGVRGCFGLALRPCEQEVATVALGMTQKK